MSDGPVFPVLLHHLSPDAREVRADLPDVTLEDVPLAQLRELLATLEAGAARDVPGASPEIRFKTAREMLIVRTAPDGLRVISWDSPLGGTPMTAAQLADSLVRPTRRRTPRRADAEDADEADVATALSMAGWLKVTLLLACILALNAYTVWRFVQPTAPEFLPEYEALPPDDSARILQQVAGEYQTGRKPGDRVLLLSPNGYLRLGVYGDADEIREETVQFARAARTGDRTFLVTNENVPFEVREDGTLVLFGTTYRRR